jgi:hypothetical protein
MVRTPDVVFVVLDYYIIVVVVLHEPLCVRQE